jgi:hypothetical protein
MSGFTWEKKEADVSSGALAHQEVSSRVHRRTNILFLAAGMLTGSLGLMAVATAITERNPDTSVAGE